jgi:5-methylcytosine-specific restriction endonuclease McrA
MEMLVRPRIRPKGEKKLKKKLSRIHKFAVLLERDPFCFYCRIPLWRETATLDHVIPQSSFSDNRIENLSLCCARCNRIKSNDTAAAFLASGRMRRPNGAYTP